MKRSERKDFLDFTKQDYGAAKIRRYNEKKLKAAQKTLTARDFKVYLRENDYWIKDL